MNRIPNHGLLAQSCICASNPSRLAWGEFKKAVGKLEGLWGEKGKQVRKYMGMKPKNDPCLNLIKIKNLKYLDFVEEVEEEMAQLIKRLKKKMLQYILLTHVHGIISLLCSLKTQK